MKKLLALTSMLACAMAAAGTLPKNIVCQLRGEVFSSAAQIRDQGGDPKTAYGVAGQYIKPVNDIDSAYVKKAVNLVFFDPAFANAGGPRLAQQIADLCLNDGKPKFQPLK